MASKAKKYQTSYSDELEQKFMFIKACSSRVPDNQHKFHCTVCNVNLLLAGGGTIDVQKHSETTGHKSWQMLCGVII